MGRLLAASQRARDSRRVPFALGLLLAGLAGCHAKQPPASDPTHVSAPTPAATDAQRKPALPPPTAPLGVAVLVSDDQPEYAAVASELTGLAGSAPVVVYSLHGKPAAAIDALTQLRAADHEQVVAIGLLAARTAQQLESSRVVFCQVFNHQEQRLVNDHTRGVEVVPPLDAAVDAWRGMRKGPLRIGVITGSGHEDVIERARRTLQCRGVTLRHQITNSDKETILALQRMLPQIDGYWLLPDNRVLSRTALREVMSLARRGGVGVLVHDPRLLEMGGLICAASDPKEIATRSYELLRQARDHGGFTGRTMQRLSRCNVQINGTVATQLGYTLAGMPRTLLAQ